MYQTIENNKKLLFDRCLDCKYAFGFTEAIYLLREKYLEKKRNEKEKEMEK